MVAFLKDSPAVKEVLYTGRGGMISFKVADEKRIPHILNSLKVFSFAESLGGVDESHYLSNDAKLTLIFQQKCAILMV